VRAEAFLIERNAEEQYGGDLVEPRQPYYLLLCLLEHPRELSLG
jgi:hypothetical protein